MRVPVVDGTTSEMLQYGGECTARQLIREFITCLAKEIFLKDWQRRIIVSIYKVMDDMGKCESYKWQHLWKR